MTKGKVLKEPCISELDKFKLKKIDGGESVGESILKFIDKIFVGIKGLHDKN